METLKKWGFIIFIGLIFGFAYIAFYNYRALGEMISKFPPGIVIAYLLGVLSTDYYHKKFGKSKEKKSSKLKQNNTKPANQEPKS